MTAKVVGAPPGAPTMLDIARDHAALGYPVFPLKPRSKIPFAATNGFKDATLDERTILHWWERHPDANVGLAVTAVFFVLDIDPKEGADPEDVLGDLELDPGDLAAVWTGFAPERSERHPDSLPGVRGMHLYFKGARRTAKTSIKGVEVRGIGSYVLAPGSVHPCGARYEGALPRAA